MSKSRTKVFSYKDDFNESIEVDVDSAMSRYSVTSLTGPTFHDLLIKDLYEYRHTTRGIEIRLVDTSNEDMSGKIVSHLVASGELDEAQIKNIYSHESEREDFAKRFAETKKHYESQTQWHLCENKFEVACLCHGDESRFSQLKATLANELALLEANFQKAKTELEDQHGVVLEERRGLLEIRATKEDSSKKSDLWVTTIQSFGFENWAKFSSTPIRKSEIGRALNISNHFQSSDDWTEELLEQESRDFTECIFPEHVPNHNYSALDAPFLKRWTTTWLRASLRTLPYPTADSHRDAFERFLFDLDYAISCGLEDGFGDFPARIDIGSLANAIKLYTANENWRSEYLTWLMMRAIVGVECVAYERYAKNKIDPVGFFGRMGKSEKFARAETLRQQFHQIVATISSPAYSLVQLRKLIDATVSTGAVFDASVFLLLDHCERSGFQSLSFPDGALYPEAVAKRVAKLKSQSA